MHRAMVEPAALRVGGGRPITSGITEFRSEIRKELTEGETFGLKAAAYKQTIQDMDATLKGDRKVLKETLSSLQEMLKAANQYLDADKSFSDHLQTIGRSTQSTGSQHPDIGNALINLSYLFKDISSLMKMKVKCMNEKLIGPLKQFLDNGAQKDLSQSFEKTWRNYDSVMLKRSTSSQWNKKQKSSEQNDGLGPDAFEDMTVTDSKRKREAKYDVCDFMLKFNDISTKTGVDFVSQLILLYDEEVKYFSKGQQNLKNFEKGANDIREQLDTIRRDQEADKAELEAIRNRLKPPKPEALSSSNESRQKEEYSLTQAGDKSFGLHISGNLNKRTEQLHRWLKRYCKVENFRLTIAHNQTSPPTTDLYLLTCQVKETPASAVDGKKNCFHVISHDRTFHFEAPTEQALHMWTTIIRNNIDMSIKSEVGDLNPQVADSNSQEHKLREFVKKIIGRIRATPGNEKCVDCGRADPTWFAVNLGILVCIHCSGAHRHTGCHNSRIRSLDLDNPVTAELLLLYMIGNQQYNDVFLADARPCDMLPADATTEERGAFIKAKHVEKRFIRRKYSDHDEMGQMLHRCVDKKDIKGLLQVFGEGVKLGSPIPNSLYDETALQIAVTNEDESSLHIVDFLAQNCQGDDIDKQDTDGKTALHFAVINNKPQSIKLLLKGGANPRVTDNAGHTPLDIAKSDQDECRQLLELAINSKHLARCDIITFNWGIEGQPDLTTCELDYTDDELDTTEVSPEKQFRSKRNLEHITRSPGFPNSQILAAQAAQKASNKKTFDPVAGGLVYNSSPRSNVVPGSSGGSRPGSATQNPRPSLPTQSPYRTSSMSGSGTSPGGMNIPANIPANSPVSSRTGGGRKSLSISSTSSSVQGPPIASTRKSSKAGHASGGMARGSVQRNRSFTMEQPSAILRSSSVSVTSPKQQQPPLIPHRGGPPGGPPALPPRTQRRKVVALYDCDADDDDELSFKQGDIIVVVDEIDDAWWFGMIDGDDNRKGIFPKNFTKPHDPTRAH